MSHQNTVNCESRCLYASPHGDLFIQTVFCGGIFQGIDTWHAGEYVPTDQFKALIVDLVMHFSDHESYIATNEPYGVFLGTSGSQPAATAIETGSLAGIVLERVQPAAFAMESHESADPVILNVCRGRRSTAHWITHQTWSETYCETIIERFAEVQMKVTVYKEVCTKLSTITTGRPNPRTFQRHHQVETTRINTVTFTTRNRPGGPPALFGLIVHPVRCHESIESQRLPFQ